MWENMQSGEMGGMRLLSDVSGRHPGGERYEGRARFGQDRRFEENAIVAYADAPQICAAGELGHARRSGVAFKSKQNVGQSGANIGRKFREVAVRGRPEQNPVGHQEGLPGLPTTARSGCDDAGSALASSASR